MNSSMPWRPLPNSLLIDPRWLQLTLQERAVFVSLILSADLDGVIELPKVTARSESTVFRFVAALAQCTPKQATAWLQTLEEVGLAWTCKEGLQVDVLQLKDSRLPTEEGEVSNDQERPLTNAERQRIYRERKRNATRNENVTATVTERNEKSNGDRNETVTEKVTERNATRNENVTPSEEIKSEKDQNTKGNREKEQKVEPPAPPRVKSSTPSLLVEQPPSEGTPARSIYNTITQDRTLAPITKHPAEYASKVIEAWPKLDCVSEVRKAALWLGGQTESKRRRYKDGRAFLSNWFKRALEDLQDNGSYATGPVKAAPHSAFSEAAKAPGKFLVHDPNEVFGGKKTA